MLAQTARERSGPIATALQKKEFEKALDLVRAALRVSPGNAELGLWKAQSIQEQDIKKRHLPRFVTH
jgi:hypothetical protein